MCGIVGYVGDESATERVGIGLEVLEYRGYDSAGVCLQGEKKFKILKSKGRVSALKALLEKEKGKCVCAIGHTRWATHGAPSEVNAHPHKVGRVCLVHNGIIENYKSIFCELGTGVRLMSDTDTEVGCALIDRCLRECESTEEAIRAATSKMQGTYAFAIMVEGEEGKIFAVRRGSPLIIAKDAGGYYLASDLTAIIPFTREYYSLKEGELAVLEKGKITVDGYTQIPWKKTELTFEGAQKGGYEHFMLKEMYEQPTAIKNCLSPRIKNGLPDFECDGIDRGVFKDATEIHIVACGSAWHAGLFGCRAIEELSGITARAFIASEYRYKMPVYKEGTLVIAVSQSGETADTLASLRHAKERGLGTLGIVNAVETSVAKEADLCAYTYAGPEIAVATTKGYATQASLLCLMEIKIGYEKGKISEEKAKSLTECLFFGVPRACDSMLSRREEISKIAKAIYKAENVFYIGRGRDYDLCCEASLKLKEISYIHSEAYAAGELKHGTISLIEAGVPVIAICTEGELADKLDSNVREVRSRGALTVMIGGEKSGGADLHLATVSKSETEKAFEALMAVQLIAYEVAYLRGCDIDKPRNLAKSVTVE